MVWGTARTYCEKFFFQLQHAKNIVNSCVLLKWLSHKPSFRCSLAIFSQTISLQTLLRTRHAPGQNSSSFGARSACARATHKRQATNNKQQPTTTTRTTRRTTTTATNTITNTNTNMHAKTKTRGLCPGEPPAFRTPSYSTSLRQICFFGDL